MKTNAPALYPNEKVSERVTAYSQEHSTPLPKHITEYHAWVDQNHERSGYMSSNFQSQFHVLLSQLIEAKRVIEIGVYAGYSALVWSHAVGPDGKVVGLEYSPEYAKLSEEGFQKLGVKNIEIIVGDAHDSLPKLASPEPYDLIFIDAEKSGYPGYLQAILDGSQPGASSRILRPGGLIVADNVLRRGIIADDSDDNPWVAKQSRPPLRASPPPLTFAERRAVLHALKRHCRIDFFRKIRPTTRNASDLAKEFVIHIFPRHMAKKHVELVEDSPLHGPWPGPPDTVSFVARNLRRSIRDQPALKDGFSDWETGGQLQEDGDAPAKAADIGPRHYAQRRQKRREAKKGLGGILEDF
ncbi:unnamed protein product [Parascedosporium putredinis]|uniref:O-methyltransferase n=1 Tax=Parascedosporium putredinis TaxID=1442378 RepID=A0A9P1H332_9PEZI|nr:unnamed protein product [Parascedosporium putredinis]CAI7995495.1 unnamed protein product [Parascedosporium putredinis]